MKFQNKKPFQRKPNLSAGRRPSLSTYYRREPSPGVKSPFQKKAVRHSLRLFVFGFLDIVALGIIILMIGYSLLLKPHPKLLVSSNAYHAASEYQTAADREFGSLSNRNKLTFNEAKVATDLRKQFPEISDVSVELPFFSETPTLRLAISKPSLQIVDGAETFVVDASGTVAANAADIKNAASLPKLVDQSGFKSAIGQPALRSADVSFIQSLVLQMKRAKVPVSTLVLPSAAEELDLHTADQPYFAKFFLAGDVLRQSGQFLAARHNFQLNGNSPAQYVDVRVPGKIFYK